MKIQSNQSVGTLIAAISLVLASCSVDQKEQELKKENIVLVHVGMPTQHSGEGISVSGQLESRETAVISTRVMGFISSIKVKLGDLVQKGQLLATISNADMLAKRAQAQAMISEAEAALKDAQKDYKRFEELHKQQSASAKEFENATLHYNSVKAKVEAAQQMRNETDAMLAYTNLVAPFSGVITQKNIDEGSMANPGMPILTIEQFAVYHVNAFVSENEVGKLKKGMNAEVTVKSTGKKFIGNVSEISPSSQFTRGQYQIKVIVPEGENPGLFSGMFVHVNIPFKNNSEDQVLMVPASAIIHKDQLTGLFTVNEDQTAQLRWVKVGGKFGEEVEILSGLRPREKFILHSEGKLYSGVPVFVK